MSKKKYKGILNISERKTFKGRSFTILCTIALAFISIVCVAPLIWTFLAGFKEQSDFFAIETGLWPKKFVWSNFTEIFTRYKMHKYVLNSVIVTIGSLVVEIVCAATAGFVISKVKPIGWKVIHTLILWTMMMPGTLNMVPLFLKFIDFPILHVSLMNTYIPMWLMAAANCFHILMFVDFFDGIPSSYIQAATIDGAGKLQIFYRILLPLSKPIIATLSVFVITGSWNSYMWPMLLLKEKELYTVTLAAINFKGFMTQPQILLTAFVLIVPMIIVYIISQKFIVDNDNSAGDKG